jgi:hypothetical protein
VLGGFALVSLDVKYNNNNNNISQRPGNLPPNTPEFQCSGSLRDVVVVVVVFNVQGNEGEALDSRTSRGVWGRAKTSLRDPEISPLTRQSSNERMLISYSSRPQQLATRVRGEISGSLRDVVVVVVVFNVQGNEGEALDSRAIGSPTASFSELLSEGALYVHNSLA